MKIKGFELQVAPIANTFAHFATLAMNHRSNCLCVTAGNPKLQKEVNDMEGNPFVAVSFARQFQMNDNAKTSGLFGDKVHRARSGGGMPAWLGRRSAIPASSRVGAGGNVHEKCLESTGLVKNCIQESSCSMDTFEACGA